MLDENTLEFVWIVFSFILSITKYVTSDHYVTCARGTQITEKYEQENYCKILVIKGLFEYFNETPCHGRRHEVICSRKRYVKTKILY